MSEPRGPEEDRRADVVPLRPRLPAADVHYEAALDPEPGPAAAAVPVDPPAPAGVLLPVIPPHLRTRAGLAAAGRRQAGVHWHRARYHALRSPRYLLLTLAWACWGVLRVAGRQVAWWWVLEQDALRSGAVAAGDTREWMRLHREAREVRKVRGIILGCEAAAAALGVAALVLVAPWWARALAALAAVPALARAGRPADRPILRPATVTPRFRRLSADVVLRAYYAAGLGHPDKPGMQVTFGAPMARDGEGSRVLVDLPYGLGLGDAVKARPRIASGLDVTESQVFIRRDPTSHRRHTLWVADRDPLAVPVGRTPLLACRPTDIWRPAPLGLDERGELVSLCLMWQSVLTGALPRQGKTFTARHLALYAALDPWVQLDVFDAAGKPDWRHFALVARSCAFGLTPTRDGLPPQVLLETLRDVKTDTEDRYRRLSALPVSVCPEGKLTREIARDPRYRMPVRVLVLDEFQEYYDLDPATSRQIAEGLRFAVKVAPAAGIIVVGATQKPAGIGGAALGQMFTAARDNFLVRFALRTSSWQVSDAVLGQGAYSEGLDSSALLPQYKGVGILRGASDASPTVRTYLADGRDAERVLTAARALRERAGTLSGMALGEGAGQPARDVLADAAAALGADSGLHWDLLARRLAARWPDRWAEATGESVSAECRGLGVPSADVRYPSGRLGSVRKGCRARDVAAARDTAGQGG